MTMLLRYLFNVMRWLLPHSRRTGATNLGARVQVSVLSGARPALEVIHEWDGSWTVSDGVADLDMPGQSVATHLSRAAMWDESITGLSSMEPGRVARRSDPAQAWQISSLAI